jgi:hypothetical protein
MIGVSAEAENQLGFHGLRIGDDLNVVTKFCDPSAALTELGEFSAYLSIRCFGPSSGNYQLYAVRSSGELVLIKKFPEQSREWPSVRAIDSFLMEDRSFLAFRKHLEQSFEASFSYSQNDLTAFRNGNLDAITISYAGGRANIILFENETGGISFSVDYRSEQLALAPPSGEPGPASSAELNGNDRPEVTGPIAGNDRADNTPSAMQSGLLRCIREIDNLYDGPRENSYGQLVRSYSIEGREVYDFDATGVLARQFNMGDNALYRIYLVIIEDTYSNGMISDREILSGFAYCAIDKLDGSLMGIEYDLNN